MARDLLLLVHLPKTAGTTLAQLMRYHYRGAFKGAGNVISRLDETEPRLQRIAETARFRASAGHVSFGLAERVLPDATYVTILREPVGRTLSQYFFLTETGNGRGLVPPWLDEDVSGIGLADAFERGYLLDDLQTRLLCGLVSPYEELPRDALERAKRNLRDRFAYVGTTERFDELLAVLNLDLGWPTTAYERARENLRRPADDMDDLRTLAAERNTLDRELHAYADELLADRVDGRVTEEAEVIQAATARWNGAQAVRSDARVEQALDEAKLVRAAYEERKQRAKMKKKRHT